jgi:hypothetical protein
MLRQLIEQRPSEDLVFTHGDYGLQQADWDKIAYYILHPAG